MRRTKFSKPYGQFVDFRDYLCHIFPHAGSTGAILKIVGICVGALSALIGIIGACLKYGSCCKSDEARVVRGTFGDEAEGVPLQEESTKV